MRLRLIMLFGVCFGSGTLFAADPAAVYSSLKETFATDNFNLSPAERVQLKALQDKVLAILGRTADPVQRQLLTEKDLADFAQATAALAEMNRTIAQNEAARQPAGGLSAYILQHVASVGGQAAGHAHEVAKHAGRGDLNAAQAAANKFSAVLRLPGSADQEGKEG